MQQPPVVRRLTEPRFWRPSVSSTFHGRDILAPVSAHLSLGESPQSLGPLVTAWVELPVPAPVLGTDGWSGEVVFVDQFGNLITNIPGEALSVPGPGRLRVMIGEQEVARYVRTYAEAEPGTLIALTSSSGMLEVAVSQGSAAERLRVRVGAPV